MKVFGDYSRYYDLLYRDKDYAAEASYVCELIREHAPGATHVLDLGCGTGRHAQLMSMQGYDVTGVDRSDDMLAVARARSSSSLRFEQGDLRELRLGCSYDVVVSLFHVFSYQTTHADLAAAFQTAHAHLRPGGVLIFDCWYGPAVLTDPPTVRVKRLHDHELDVIRIAEPVMHPNDNTVDVCYQMVIHSRADGLTSEFTETHVMRYLFNPEVIRYMAAAKFAPVACEEWMSRAAPGSDTWNVVFVARNES